MTLFPFKEEGGTKKNIKNAPSSCRKLCDPKLELNSQKVGMIN